MIKQSRKQESESAREPAAAGANDHFHGDLRKGAYLKRRAADQMQAVSAASRQAGATTKTSKPG